MTNKRSGPKRFTPTTVILIIALLGAVAGASRLATPAPPEPPKSQEAVARDKQAQLQQREKMSKQQMQQEMQAQAQRTVSKPVADPSAITIDNKFFLQVKPGSEGLKQTEEQFKKQTAIYEAYKRKLQAEKKDGSPSVGQPRPVSVPPVK